MTWEDDLRKKYPHADVDNLTIHQHEKTILAILFIAAKALLVIIMMTLGLLAHKR